MQARRGGPRSLPNHPSIAPYGATIRRESGQIASEIRMVQALRAAACLMVTIYHTLQVAAGARAIAAWPNGSAGVDLFFVISGFVMLGSTRRLTVRPRAAWIFLRRRAARLVPLYWTLTCIKCAIATLAPGLAPHTRLTPWNLLASLLFIPARDLAGEVRPVLPVGWSLNFEVFFYMLFALALALHVRVWWVLPALAATAAAGFFRAESWPAPFYLANGMVLEFAAGMLIWAAATHTYATRPARASAPALALMTVGTVLLLTLPLAGQWRFLVWGAPAACILLGAVALESRFGAKLPGAVLAVGDASYAIYLVHPFIVPALAAHGWLGAAAAIPISIAAGLLVHTWFDAPVQRRARRFTQGVAYAA